MTRTTDAAPGDSRSADSSSADSSSADSEVAGRPDVGAWRWAADRFTARWVRLPWWAQALIIFALSRVVTTLLFLWVGSQSTSQSRAGLNPSFVGLSSAWDGQWYWLIADQGYPVPLPRTSTGDIDTNQWAFLPLYPDLVKLLALANGPAWPPTAIGVSLVFGFGAAVMLALLLRPRIGSHAALFAVVVFSVSPLSFMLQTAYAESMGIFLTLAALCLIDRHRYVEAMPVTVALAFTRPGVLALALAVALQLVQRIWRARRCGVRLRRADVASAAALVVVATLSGFAWTVIVGIATGVPDAYFQTELAWRAIWMGRSQFAYFTPWLFAAHFWAGRFGLPAIAGPIALAVIIVGFAGALFLPAVRRLGPTIRFWCASYAAYLLAVFFPQSSIFRLLMPMAPLAGAIVPRSTAVRIVVVAVSIALQALWLWCTYGPFQTYWGVP